MPGREGCLGGQGALIRAGRVDLFQKHYLHTNGVLACGVPVLLCVRSWEGVFMSASVCGISRHNYSVLVDVQGAVRICSWAMAVRRSVLFLWCCQCPGAVTDSVLAIRSGTFKTCGQAYARLNTSIRMSPDEKLPQLARGYCTLHGSVLCARVHVNAELHEHSSIGLCRSCATRSVLACGPYVIRVLGARSATGE